MAQADVIHKLSVGVGVAIAILAIRVAFYWGTSRFLLSRAPAKGSKKERTIWVKKVQEEIFTTIGGIVLLAFGTHIIFNRNGPSCDWVDTRDCYTGFPDHYRPMDRDTLMYFTLELAWYLHQVPKHWLGVGVTDSALMNAHHLVTIILVSLAMTTGLHRAAAIILSLLNISNPFLHIAKIANIFDFKLAKVVLFAFFALIFFLTRIVAYPWIILKCSLYDSMMAQPRLWFGDLAWIYLTINSMLIAIYFMQMSWMQGIARILVQAVSPKGSAQELRDVANSHDTVTMHHKHDDELKKAQ